MISILRGGYSSRPPGWNRPRRREHGAALICICLLMASAGIIIPIEERKKIYPRTVRDLIFQCCHFILPKIPGFAELIPISQSFAKNSNLSKVPGENSKIRQYLVPKIVKKNRSKWWKTPGFREESENSRNFRQFWRCREIAKVPRFGMNPENASTVISFNPTCRKYTGASSTKPSTHQRANFLNWWTKL